MYKYFVGHDHAETQSTGITFTQRGSTTLLQDILCVNAAASVPPVSADLRTTGSITVTSAQNI
jgi:hypothetical protein